MESLIQIVNHENIFFIWTPQSDSHVKWLTTNPYGNHISETLLNQLQNDYEQRYIDHSEHWSRIRSHLLRLRHSMMDFSYLFRSTGSTTNTNLLSYINDWVDRIPKIVDYLGQSDNHCLECGVDMGECNPRQLCGKTYCFNKDGLFNFSPSPPHFPPASPPRSPPCSPQFYPSSCPHTAPKIDN